MKLKYFFIFSTLSIAVFINCTQAQEKTNNIPDKGFFFSPNLAGGHIEFASLIFVNEVGGVLDIDILKKESETIYSFGTRFSFEHYSYFQPGGATGGNPFNDYCFFIRHSARSESIHTNFLVGIAYHQKSDFYKDEKLFRAGIEFKYNINRAIALLIKGSSSFKKDTGYFGLGIAVGYY